MIREVHLLADDHSTAPSERAPVRGLRRLALATLLVTLALIAMGGLVRATDTGLACGTDWPGCHGAMFPTQADLPPGFTLLEAWLEHGHRLLASVVGMMALALMVWAIAGHRDRPAILWPSVLSVGLIGVQAYLGRQVVLGLLHAGLVTAHLGMALAVAACVAVLTVESYLPRAGGAAGRGRRLGLARATIAVAGLVYAQALVGATLTGVGGGLAFRGFPLADGQVLPPIATLPEALHMVHRGLGLVAFAAVVALSAAAVRARRRAVAAGEWDRRQRWLVKLPMWAATLVTAQVLLGAANIWTNLSTVTGVAHLIGASWLWTMLVVSAALSYRLAPAQSGLVAASVASQGAAAGEAAAEAASR